MPDEPEKAFIPRHLRPDLTFPDDGSPPGPGGTLPDTPRPELRRRAADLLGAALRDCLGVGDPDAPPLGPEQVCGRSSDVAWTAVDGEAVLLDLASGYYFSLNPVGTAIWELLDGERTLGAIHDAVRGRFRVDRETAWEDLAALVRRLRGEKLVTVR